MQKRSSSAAEALSGLLFDGMTIAAGGFGLCGIPELSIAAIREAGVAGTVICERIEVLPPQNADAVSARALAELGTLLGYADRHLAKGGIALFSKGMSWEKELAMARNDWSFSYEALKSNTEEGSVILRIGDIARV